MTSYEGRKNEAKKALSERDRIFGKPVDSPLATMGLGLNEYKPVWIRPTGKKPPGESFKDKADVRRREKLKRQLLEEEAAKGKVILEPTPNGFNSFIQSANKAAIASLPPRTFQMSYNDDQRILDRLTYTAAFPHKLREELEVGKISPVEYETLLTSVDKMRKEWPHEFHQATAAYHAKHYREFA